MNRSQSNIIEFAARLVKCSDDTPTEETRIRCQAANVIKDCYEKIHRLEAERDAWKDTALHMNGSAHYGSSESARVGRELLVAAQAAREKP